MASEKLKQMQERIEDVRNIFDSALDNVTSSSENWKSLLRTISYSYDYSFDDNLIINQTMPEATYLHNLNWWNKRFRVVDDYKNNASVYLLSDYDRGIQANLINLYDISITKYTPDLRGAYIHFSKWDRGVQHTKVVHDCFLKDDEKPTPVSNSNYIENLGGISNAELSLAKDITLRIPADVWNNEKKKNKLRELINIYATQSNIVNDSNLRHDVWNVYNRFVSQSCDYAICNRLDLDTNKFKILAEDIEYLNKLGILTYAGNAICDIVKRRLKIVTNQIIGFDTWVEKKCQEELSKGGVITEDENGVKIIERQLEQPEYEGGRSVVYTNTKTGETTTWNLKFNNQSIDNNKKVLGSDISLLHDDEKENSTDNQITLDDLSTEELDDYYLALEPRKAPNIADRKSYIPMSHDNLHQLFIRNIMFYALAKTGYKQKIYNLFMAGADFDNEDMLEYIQSAFDNGTVEFNINSEKFSYTTYKEGVLFEGIEQDKEYFVKWENISETLQVMTMFGELGFLTVPEQLKAITRTEEQFKNAHFEIPEEVVNYVLRTSLKTKSGTDTAKYEIYEFWKENKPSETELAAFLRKVYLNTDTIKFPLNDGTTSRFCRKGLMIVESIGLDNKKIQDTYTWNEVAKKTIALLEADKYLTSKELEVGYDGYKYKKASEKSLINLRTEIINVIEKSAVNLGLGSKEKLSFTSTNLTFSSLNEYIKRITTYSEEKSKHLENHRSLVLTCLNELFDKVFDSNLKSEISAVSEKLGGEKLIDRAIAKDEPATIEESFFYEYEVGTRVYIGGIEYEISYFDDKIVKLFDVAYTVSTREMSKVDFDKAIALEKLNNFLRIYNATSKVTFANQKYATYILSNGEYLDIRISPEGVWSGLLYSNDFVLKHWLELEANSIGTALECALQDFFPHERIKVKELDYQNFLDRVEEAEKLRTKTENEIEKLPPVTPISESVFELSIPNYPENTIYAELSKTDITFYNEELGRTVTYNWICTLYNADYGEIGSPVYLNDSNSIEEALCKVYLGFGIDENSAKSEPKRIDTKNFHKIVFGNMTDEKKELIDFSAAIYHFLFLNDFDDFDEGTGEHSVTFRDVERDVLSGNVQKYKEFLKENKSLDTYNRVDSWLERLDTYKKKVNYVDETRFDREVGTEFIFNSKVYTIKHTTDKDIFAQVSSNDLLECFKKEEYDSKLLTCNLNSYIDKTSPNYHGNIPYMLFYTKLFKATLQTFLDNYNDDFIKIKNNETGRKGKEIEDEIEDIVERIINEVCPKQKKYLKEKEISEKILNDVWDFAEVVSSNAFNLYFELDIGGIENLDFAPISYDKYKNIPYKLDTLKKVWEDLFYYTYQSFSSTYYPWFGKVVKNNYNDEEKSKIQELIYRCYLNVINKTFPEYKNILSNEQEETLISEVIAKAQSNDRYNYKDVFDRKSVDWAKELTFIKISNQETEQKIIDNPKTEEIGESEKSTDSEETADETEKAVSVPLSENENGSEEISDNTEDEIHKVAITFGLDEKLLREHINRKPNKNNISEWGYYDEIKKSADIEKAKAYFEKVEGKELILPRVRIKLDSYLREFILECAKQIEKAEKQALEKEKHRQEYSYTIKERKKPVRLNYEQSKEESEKRNYKIVGSDIDERKPSERITDNLNAIRMLKELEEENRYATPDEQEILSKYSGWGGLSNIFDEGKNSRYQELKELLTKTEYELAAESSLTAYYTPDWLVKDMYTLLDRMGFRGGNILEPSCGTGRFIGNLPDNMQDKTRFVGVELDNISGRIAKQLYQKAEINVGGFEDIDLPENYFDLAIGNVPFGNYTVYDSMYNKQNFLIHDYFLAKTLKLVRPNGIVAFITTHGTLDKKDYTVRTQLNKEAQLLGAIRLPNNTFANTSVAADILFFRKREKSLLHTNEFEWKETNGYYGNNRYFDYNKNLIWGNMGYIDTQYGKEYVCLPDDTYSHEAKLNNAINEICTEINQYKEKAEAEKEEETETENVGKEADSNIPEFSFGVTSDGDVYYRETKLMYPSKFNGKQKERVIGMCKIRDTLRDLLTAETEENNESEIFAKMRELNTVYDDFVDKYDRIFLKKNSNLFQDDKSFSLLMSLEVIEDDKFIKKADVFSERVNVPNKTITETETASEALVVSIQECGFVDMEYMGKLCHMTEKEMYNELKGVIFLSLEERPIHKYVTKDELLSGNVRNKLARAKELAIENSEFELHCQELAEVVPKWISAEEIGVNLGSPWIPSKYINVFAEELFGGNYNDHYLYVKETGNWVYDGDGSTEKAKSVYGVTVNGEVVLNGYDLVEYSLNSKRPTVRKKILDGNKYITVRDDEATVDAIQKKILIEEEFQKWIFADESRKKDLEEIYNKKFNSEVVRTYDGSFIKFHDINPNIDLRQHQKNGIANALYGGNTMLAHCVGAGKTYQLDCIAYESKKLGLCNKPMMIVPNATIAQAGKEFQTLYPSANILLATPKDWASRAAKRKFVGKVATGNYDCIILTYEQFELLPLSQERIEKYMQDEYNELEIAYSLQNNNLSKKNIKKHMKSVEAKLKKAFNQSKQDDMIPFEELGVDLLIVDEAHNFKNLGYTTSMTISGVNATNSKRAEHLYHITKYLNEKTNERGVVFATGTPISNSISEVYTMQRFLTPSKLEEYGLTNFDNWAKTYGKVTVSIEHNVLTDKFESKDVFCSFQNIPELFAMLGWNIISKDELDLDLPVCSRINVVCEMTDFQKEYMDSLVDRSEELHRGISDPTKDNWLNITNDGKTIALDPRLIDPSVTDTAGTKVDKCSKNVYDVWLKTQNSRSTQLIFTDRNAPTIRKDDDEKTIKTKKDFSLNSDIKSRLVAMGIPDKEIQFISDWDKNAKTKETIANLVRNGTVRVLIGSTQKMGVGLNMQNKMIALHHLDCPWRPCDLQQREGRIERQGNENKNVQIYTYVTKGSFDYMLYGTVLRKATAFNTLLSSGGQNNRIISELSEDIMNFIAVKAAVSDSPEVAEYYSLDGTIKSLEMQMKKFQETQEENKNKLNLYPIQIENYKKELALAKKDLETANANPKMSVKNFKLDFLGKTYTNRQDVGEVFINHLVLSKLGKDETFSLFDYRGFHLSLEIFYTKNSVTNNIEPDFRIIIKGNLTDSFVFSKTEAVFVMNKVDSRIDRKAEIVEEKELLILQAENDLEQVKEIATMTFPKLEEYYACKKRYKELDDQFHRASGDDIKGMVVVEAEAKEIKEKEEAVSVPLSDEEIREETDSSYEFDLVM